MISFAVGNFCGILGICLVLGVYKLRKKRKNIPKKDSFCMETQALPSSGVSDALVYDYVDDINKISAPEVVQLQQNTAYGQLLR